MNFNTALLHKSFSGEKQTGATVEPIYQTSSFAHESAQQLEKVFENKASGYAYTRISNPTVSSFEKRIASLEGGACAVACSSGSAAAAMSLLSILESGDEIISCSALYGGTLDLFSDLKSFGINVRYVDDAAPSLIEPLISDKTKAIFAEVIGNPKLNVIDIKSLAELSHSKGIPLIIDSTTATPYIVKPIELGADIVIHSSSKYINGGGNSISGVIIDSAKFKWDFNKHSKLKKYEGFGKLAYTASLRNGLWRDIGCCLAPMNAFLNSVGLETLGLRMERCCSNSLQLARHLESKGLTVNYPALESSPYYELTQTQLGGKGGAILTLRMGSKERAFKLINSLEYAAIASNIGDVRTLVIHPFGTLFAHSNESAKNSAGVYDDTVRVSVGIEDIDDLIMDFDRAIALCDK